MVGVTAFQHTTRNIERLVAFGVKTSIQTTVVGGKTDVIDWMTQYCLDIGVHRLSFLSFIPRGNGTNHRVDFSLTALQRRELHRMIRQKRHALHGRIDIRWLDFNSQVIPVAEPDGRIVLEGATESMDQLLYRIPESKVPVEAGIGP